MGVAPLVIVIIGVRLLNKGMIRLTGTNQELIQEIWSGQHNDVIPQRFQNDVALDGITRFLSRAQVCNVCGYRNKALSKRFREHWECPCCGAIHDVDLNAAKNILNEGLRLLS